MRPLSYTKFSTYDRCPLMYRFCYVDRLPEKPRAQYSLGRSIHKALELFHQHDPPPAPLDTVLGYLEDNWVREGYSSPDIENENKALAMALLTDFHGREAQAYKRPFAVEHTFNVDIGGIHLVGRIDVINQLDDGTFEILDYKSGQNTYEEEAVARSDQLALYQMAIEKEFERKVSLLTIYQLREGRATSVPSHSDDEKAALKRRLLYVANLIRAEIFEARLTDDCPCDWPENCPYFKDLFKGTGQTTLIEHDPSSMAGPQGRIIPVVEEYARLVEANEGGTLRAQELELKMRKYCDETGALRIFAGDIVATLICITGCPEDEWYCRFEIGKAPALKDMDPK
jgi:RecB family exonuclease